MASFESQMRDIIKNRTGVTEEIFRAVSLQVTEQVITRTPVDTGRARGNWNASIDTADDSVSDSARPGDATNKARATVGRLEIGNTFTLTNGLPYIQKLEYGSSAQAANGMVRVTVEEFNQRLAEVVRRVSRT